jgi:hypothetical protein
MSRKGSFDEPMMVTDTNPNVGSLRRQMSAVDGSQEFSSRNLVHQSGLLMSTMKPNTMSMFESTKKTTGYESLSKSTQRMHNMSIMNVSASLHRFLTLNKLSIILHFRRF